MAENKNAEVLIVDDEIDLVKSYQAFLEGQYSVHTATDGTEALEKLDETTDVMLLDRRMPGLTGDEVLEEVRASEVDCRVVMVTAVDPDTDLLGMDFDEYLVKPVTGDDLREAVNRMLARDRMEQQIQEMFALASKLATLELKLDIEQQERSEEHQKLLEEFYQLRDEVEFSDLDDEYYSAATIEKLQSLLEANRP